MKIASLQYCYDFPKNFDAYREKIARLVAEHAREGVQLLLFPEYAGFEMISFATLEQFYEDHSLYLELFRDLSKQHQMFICSGSQVVRTDQGIFNRAYFFAPNGKIAHQDKCILTPFEKEEGILSAGEKLNIMETSFGKVGICICYDVEFPALVKSLVNAGVQLILVPAYTASVQGYYRVFISCRARALEGQCFVVQSALVGKTDIEIAYGASAFCGPIDEHFPEDGVLAVGLRDQVMSVQATLDFRQLESVRAKGQTHNYCDAKELEQRHVSLELCDLR